MTKFVFHSKNPNQQYVNIECTLETNADKTEIQLPAWRPGRYELGNFAKNVKSFHVYNEEGIKIESRKILKDRWTVDTENTNSITVKYQYYAAELNAGSTFLDATQLYVNPVNCCVYTDESFDKEIHVQLEVPSHWNVATSLNNEDGIWKAKDFDEFLDSPFIASELLQYGSYEIGETKFHVWFNGEIKPDWDRLITDFEKFSQTQINKFLEFPVNDYHFLIQILPYRAYHGVEHLNSTVISLGPSYEVFGDLYKELLGVSSHELYHTWNVKSIRPIELYPYDFSKENYSPLGYLCEGVTTYMGDLFLLKSKVFTEEQYFNELNTQLQRHFDNPARFTTNVAASSFDTWLDGYVAGAPGRKVSIYVEGCLLSMVIDARIIEATKSKYGLDEVMKRLYYNFACEGKGVSEKDYQNVIEAVSGISFEDFFQNYIHDNKPFESIIQEAFEILGLELHHKPSDSFSEAKLGFKSINSGKHFVVNGMYTGGPAELGGMMLNDEIIGVNDYMLNGDLDKWCSYFEEDVKEFLINRKGQIIRLTLPEVNRNFYMNYSVLKLKEPTTAQKKAFETWKN